MALSLGLYRSILLRMCSVISDEVISRSRMARAASDADNITIVDGSKSYHIGIDIPESRDKSTHARVTALAWDRW